MSPGEGSRVGIIELLEIACNILCVWRIFLLSVLEFSLAFSKGYVTEIKRSKNLHSLVDGILSHYTRLFSLLKRLSLTYPNA